MDRAAKMFDFEWNNCFEKGFFQCEVLFLAWRETREKGKQNGTISYFSGLNSLHASLGLLLL